VSGWWRGCGGVRCGVGEGGAGRGLWRAERMQGVLRLRATRASRGGERREVGEVGGVRA
jgi:hypothetical protein